MTVTDADRAEAVDTVVFTFNQPPTAAVTVTATRLDEDSERTGADAYTVNAVAAYPNLNGNADNEWDILENSRLVLDGSGSSDPDGTVEGYKWSLTYSYAADGERNLDIGLPEAPEGVQTSPKLTTGAQTLGNLTADQSPYTAYYSLAVVDDEGQESAVSLVKIVIHDLPNAPAVELTVAAAGTTGSTPAVQATGFENVYTVIPGSTLLITSEATDKDDVPGSPTTITEYKWEGGTAPADNPATADVDESETTRRVEIGENADIGSATEVSLTVTDNGERSTIATVQLIVSDNNSPLTADILNSNLVAGPDGIPTYTTPDGAAGGDIDPRLKRPTGEITLRGVGFDHGNPKASLSFRWLEVALDNETGEYETVGSDDTVLNLTRVDTATTSFRVPEVEEPTTVMLELTVSDKRYARTTSYVSIVISPQDAPPIADAGDYQLVTPGSYVYLNGSNSSDPDKGDKISKYEWELVGVETSPSTTAGSTRVSDQVFAALADFIASDDDDDGFYTYPEVLTGNPGKFPYFRAPMIPDGISAVVLTFRLTVTDSVDNDTDESDGDDDTDTDTVAVTIANTFFSGQIDSPDFCINRSLGGPRTYPLDSNNDGVADVCSLNTTRRATVAIQNALELMVVYRTELGGDHIPAASFRDLIYGREAAADDPSTASVDETATKITGTCETLPEIGGDSALALAQDVCSTGEISNAPAAVDPAAPSQFFSGIIDNPNFCTNMSLGGVRTYPFDSDSDGVADTCSLPYTRREAVARQNALEMLKDHSSYPDFLRYACTSLGTTDFGDDPDDLAEDQCSPKPDEDQRGEPLPTPTT